MASRNRGAALFVVIATMATLTMLSTTMYMAVHGARERERALRIDDAVSLLARAGIHRAAAALSADNQVYRGEQSTPLGDGEFSVTVATSDSAREFRVESTGALTDGPYVIRSITLFATVRIQSDGSVRISDVTRTASVTRRMRPAKP